MSNKKKSSITHIRSWVRTNGEMSEDGKSITYSCAELEAVIREAKAMHKEEMINFSYKVLNESNDSFNGYVDEEKIYNETFGDNNE